MAAGKRLDVIIPAGNTALLELLASEHKKTGMSESRLLVQFATRFVELTSGQYMPLLVAASAAAAGPAAGSALPQSGVQGEADMPLTLNSAVLDSFVD